jgi:hypothetical protein
MYAVVGDGQNIYCYFVVNGYFFFIQSTGFWIQFVTSFRSFIKNFVLDGTDRPESYEEAFIDMLKMLTTENR